ncbi:hypothetical protein FACS1894158_08800 [Betaproteobacteria bacterium]|nr:hypothetical protein FACS1894158_08800 [Betaproteobacteria bacterium]
MPWVIMSWDLLAILSGLAGVPVSPPAVAVLMSTIRSPLVSGELAPSTPTLTVLLATEAVPPTLSSVSPLTVELGT